MFLLKILFMGTPDIAAQCLSALIEAGHDVCAVFTREDKPVGRKQIMTPPPVKRVALTHNVSVYQPKNLKEPQTEQIIRDIAPDIIVVVAYGCILPKGILNIPRYGCINLHVSKLPKYRGAAPVQWAVINGEKETGVTVMYMDEGLDTGDIITMCPVEIYPDETAGELFERVTETGCKTLCETLLKIENNTAVRKKQNGDEASYAPQLSKETAQLDLKENAEKLNNLIRGLNPWPVAYFVDSEGKKIKVLKAKVADLQANPGTVLSTKPLVVACGCKALELCTVVSEGKKPMDGSAWAMGRRFKNGDNVLCEV